MSQVFTRTDAVRISQTFLQVDTTITIVGPDTTNFFATPIVGHLQVLRNGIDQSEVVDFNFQLSPPGIVFVSPVAPGDIVKTRCWRG